MSLLTKKNNKIDQGTKNADENSPALNLQYILNLIPKFSQR
jgi:hypothetical protein